MPLKIYALLAGIDAYPPPVPKLNGCLKDVAKILEYLQSLGETEVLPVVLLNEQATKQNITKAFFEHLGCAGEGDTALFYFSGHGSQELADEVFSAVEPSKRIQALIPYDGVRQEAGVEQYNLLADKELRYLVYRVSAGNPHILTIFDCCHAGENTRSIAGEEILKKQYLYTKSLENAFPVRPWSDFLFSGSLSKEQFQHQSIKELLPEGRHVQLGACASTEVAFQRNGESIFTQALLEVLHRSNGQVTYYDLVSRVRHYVKGYFKQTPVLYAGAGLQTEVFRYFLGQSYEKGAPLSANVVFTNGRWVMDMGRIQGISSAIKSIAVQAVTGNQEYEARLGKIEASSAELIFDKGPMPDQEGLYKAFPPAILSAPFNLWINNQEGAETFETALQKWLPPGINVVGNAYEADYCLWLHKNQADIVLPEDTERRPLVRSLPNLTDDTAKIVAGFLHHIARWQFVKELHNPNSFLWKTFPVLIEFFEYNQSGESVPMPMELDDLSSTYQVNRDRDLTREFKIKLTNVSNTRLHVSLLYLSMNFQVYTELLKPAVVGLDPGQSVYVFEGETLEITFEAQLKYFKWKEGLNYFKLIVNTAYFDVAQFEQEQLPPPVGVYRAGRVENKKLEKLEEAQDWTTRLITLRMKNPYVEGGLPNN